MLSVSVQHTPLVLSCFFLFILFILFIYRKGLCNFYISVV
nr:MAG TPA: Membrane-associated protein [Bacteriophage sp.]